jgi:hypothetical protein
MTRFRRVVAVAAAALLAAAVAMELRKPADRRTWQGRVAGIPYDLRPPTAARVRQRVWNPDDPRVLTPHAFGIGWTVNLGRLARRAGAA